MESPTYEQPTHRTSPFAWALFVVAVLIIGWLIWRATHERTLTPEETLEELKSSSLPVTASSEERTVELESMAKASTPVTKSAAQRQRELEALSQ